MKELKIAFDLVREKYPNWGDYICLCECIKSKGYSDSIIKKAFKKFVTDCPPYGKRETKEYVDYLISKTKKI